MIQNPNILLRYPGGKSRMLGFLIPRLSHIKKFKLRLCEPFAGGCAVFLTLKPQRAFISDINAELVDLYRGIRRYPHKVWEVYKNFPSTKSAYYEIRNWKHFTLDLPMRAARTLYLNRTCFKGMWRHNSNGDFNVGYGGQDRRWVVCGESITNVAKLLSRASIKCMDFEESIDRTDERDFIFLDPPYQPGERDMKHDHYLYGTFCFEDHKRLVRALKRASKRGVCWAMTTSGHSDIVGLFSKQKIIQIPKGTGNRIGSVANKTGEVLVTNCMEVGK